MAKDVMIDDKMVSL